MSFASRSTAHELFAARAAAQPDSIALLYGNQSLRYSDLNQRANRLAHILIRRGLGPGMFAGIYFEPSLDAIVAILAILKTGGAYVPLEVRNPPAALAAVIQQANLPLVLTNSGLAPDLPESAAAPICLDLLAAELATECTGNPPPAATATSPAAAFFTSGSTGEPKGIVRFHGNIPLKILWATFGPEEVYAFNRPLSVSVSVSRIFQPLLAGVPLLIVPTDTVADVTAFVALLEAHKVTNFSIVPSHLRALLDGGGHIMARLSRVRTLTIDGALSEPELISRLAAALPGCTLMNHYATTETGPCLMGVRSSGAPPSGLPVEGCTVYLLDQHRQPVEDGAAGEIFVASPWIPDGYLNRPDLSAERFMADPLAPASGKRCFRTGDLGRRLPDGSIEILGRADDRVNIRGFLVEPAEVESMLRQYPGIREAAVISLDVGRETRLAAYFVPSPDVVVVPVQLRHFLAQRMAAHKVPFTFVLLDRLPLTAGGKLDRRALPHPSVVSSRDANAPETDATSTPTEIQLVKIWEEVFGFGPVSSSSHFFDLGGDSLTAMVVAALVRKDLAVEIDMRTFTTHPVLTDLAVEIDRLRAMGATNEDATIASVAPDEPCPLSFSQEIMWAHIHHSPQNANDFVKGRAYRLAGPLDLGALESAVRWVSMRHDILRTVFKIVDGKPVQLVSGPAPELLSFEDLSSRPDPGSRANEILAEELAQPFDLAAGPLLRLRVVKTGASEHRLLQVNHHIISDRWSWTLYFHELGRAYEAFCAGSAPPPLSRGIQYRDYAASERRLLAPGTLLRARVLEWWRGQVSGRPLDRPLPLRRRFTFSKPSVADAMRRRNIDRERASRMKALCIREGATYFAIGVAAFAALLAERKDHSSVTIGIYVNNRWRPELQEVLGDFTSLVPVCLDCDRKQPFREWLRSVRETLLNVQAHARLPLSQFGDDLRAAGIRPPEVHAIVLGSVADQQISFGAVEVCPMPYPAPTAMPWGLTLVVAPLEAHQPYIEMDFDARLYDAAKTHRLFERFHRLLDGVARNADGSVAEILARFS